MYEYVGSAIALSKDFKIEIPSTSYYEKGNPLKVVNAESAEIKILMKETTNLVQANANILVDIWVS